MRKEHGFSLIELMIAAAVGSTILYICSSGIYSLMAAHNASTAKEDGLNWSRSMGNRITRYFETRDTRNVGFDILEKSGNNYGRILIERKRKSGVEQISVYNQCRSSSDAPKDFVVEFCGIKCPRGSSIETVIATEFNGRTVTQTFPPQDNSASNSPIGFASCVVDNGGDSVSMQFRTYALRADKISVSSFDYERILMLKTLANDSSGLLPDD